MPIRNWLLATATTTKRCRPAHRQMLRLAAGGDLEHYYRNIPTAGYFLNGLMCRTPELALTTMRELIDVHLERASGHDADVHHIVAALAAATPADCERLRAVWLFAKAAEHRSKIYYLLKAAYFLSTLITGCAENPPMAALIVGASVVAHLKREDRRSDAEAEVNDWLRKRVPFSVWRKGFDEYARR